ncbi:MAG: hypothetical protein COT73_03995 [Bdellovibrio sp. CG10_big_fil_rev_8_21_14_0_10_47_8]|nr:MAG: hypothetical protein COT73_03995 [Bdellovibrio sp. CG10_big_fil_rev_8_21_14_0_10_47_8]
MDAADFLKNIFQDLQKKESAELSLRGFAKKLGVSPGRLSQYFSKKRLLTRRVGDRIATALAFSDQERDCFFQLIKTTSEQKVIERRERRFQSLHEDAGPLIGEDDFDVLLEWHYPALLELLKIRRHGSSPEVLSQQLDLPEHQIDRALRRLQQVGFLREENGRLRPRSSRFRTTKEIPGSALRASQEQSILLGLKSLRQDPSDRREISCGTMAVNTRKLPQAKELIRQFNQKLRALLEDGEPDEVYNLNIQLVPLTRK